MSDLNAHLYITLLPCGYLILSYLYALTEVPAIRPMFKHKVRVLGADGLTSPLEVKRETWVK